MLQPNAFGTRQRYSCKAIICTSEHRRCRCSRAAQAASGRHDFLIRQVRALASRAAGGGHDAQLSGDFPHVSVFGPSTAEGQQGPTFSVLSYRDRPEVARAAMDNIAAAFEDDPSSFYFCRPNQRVQYYRSVLSCLLDWYPDDKQLVCTLPPDAAAVVYMYPRLQELGPWAKLMRGGLAALACVRLERLVEGLVASDFFEGLREEFFRARGPFLYVSVMAVRPDRQGRGLGTALLAFVCDRADAAGLHCYIEATSPRNRALYERFGFQLIREWCANPEMPYTYVLSRPPHPLGFNSTPADADVSHPDACTRISQA